MTQAGRLGPGPRVKVALEAPMAATRQLRPVLIGEPPQGMGERILTLSPSTGLNIDY